MIVIPYNEKIVTNIEQPGLSCKQICYTITEEDMNRISDYNATLDTPPIGLEKDGITDIIQDTSMSGGNQIVIGGFAKDKAILTCYIVDDGIDLLLNQLSTLK